MSDHVLRTLNNGVMIITLNRPDRLNSLNAEMLLTLRKFFEEACHEPACRAILLTGTGRGFCAGQDLADRDPSKWDTPPDLSHTVASYYSPLIRLIRSIQKPIVCAVNGVAAGAGANLALACDIVVAAQNAKFIQSFAKAGLVPDAGGTWMLPRLVGEARAKFLTLTATPIKASQAEDWGLIAHCIPDEQLMEEALSMAEGLAKGPTLGLGLTKIALQNSADQSLDQQLELEAEYQGQCGRSSDYKEGVTAFLEKRAAKFTGKELD